MKKERYFREELQRLFIGFAIVPAVVFTLACCLVFMALLLKGKWEDNSGQGDYAAGELNRALELYGKELESLAGERTLFSGELSNARRARLFEEIYGVSAQAGYEARFFILGPEREPLLSSGGELPGFLKLEPEVDWGILGAMKEEPERTAVRLEDAWEEGGGSIALGKAAVFEGEIKGYAVCTIHSSRFRPVLGRGDAQLVIADRFGRVYLSSGEQFLSGSGQVAQRVREGGRLLSYQKNLYLRSVRPSRDGNFLIYALSDIQSIAVSLGLNIALAVTALLVMTVWVFFSTRKVTEKKTEDFYRILDGMAQAEKGNLDRTIKVESNNEFKTIADAYNSAVAGLKRQMENNQRMAELVAAAQNKQLESQFNPHFLYNTLETIRYMCRIEPEAASRMIVCLSNLLRYSLDTRVTEVTVEEDLEHLENYMGILLNRFGQRLACRIDVQQEALSCRIPKLMLQPMIENAVKYGFGNRDSLVIELKGYIHEENLVMICRDDGEGMTQAVLEEVTALLEKKENTSRHSGLYNIHRRIRLLYGRAYGVEIKSREGQGTTLVVTMPARLGGSTC